MVVLLCDLSVICSDIAILACFASLARNLSHPEACLKYVSAQTVVMFLLVRVFHMFCHVQRNHFQSSSSLGKYVMIGLDSINSILGVLSLVFLYQSRVKLSPDTFCESLTHPLRWGLRRALQRKKPDLHKRLDGIASCTGSAHLAIIFMPVLKYSVVNGWFQAFLSSFSIVYLLPQLYMFYLLKKMPKAVADFVFYAAITKGLTLFFFILLFFDPLSYPQGTWTWSDVFGTSSSSQRNLRKHAFLALVELINVLVVIDFVWIYVKYQISPCTRKNSLKRNNSTDADFVYLDQMV